ncbi:N-acetylmuramoyl-L-alanine amidase [Microbaculum marinum]|uniref:N-acetylmuramoyl-L-alanine amidase n=1 Tax=Microbaculum marinum TaxID=1764581 RepID=A0AAW9RV10_9HYPH
MTVSSEIRESPNHDSRNGAPVDILLLHYTGMTSAEAALDRLCDPTAKVSCHWFVHVDGRVVRLVPESERAWHAGVSSWAGEIDINARSVGIEIDNPGHEFGYRPFPDAQVEAVAGLCREILARHPIPSGRVLAHSDVAPARKQDPGELFPWARLASDGIGHWVEPERLTSGRRLEPGAAGPDVADLQGRLASYGYGITPDGVYDAATVAVVTAFQRHFRPARVDGIADVSTRRTLDRLLRALPRR